jgi:AcrR family transcriptional regulator
MSSAPPKPDTRTRILQTALELLRGGAGGASLGQIAKAAGLSRQAVYLHFRDRADLYMAMVRYVDEARDLAGALRRLELAPTGEATLAEAVALQAEMNPALYPLSSAMDAVRRQDEALERAWQDRLSDRLVGARQIAARLKADGVLRPDLDVQVAADLIWSMLSLRMWEDLVNGRGWSAEQYKARVGDALRRALLVRP